MCCSCAWWIEGCVAYGVKLLLVLKVFFILSIFYWVRGNEKIGKLKGL
jgi:hypothetical protein